MCEFYLYCYLHINEYECDSNIIALWEFHREPDDDETYEYWLSTFDLSQYAYGKG